MRRPTYSEIQGKIRQAKEAITREEFRVLKPSVVARDALELGIQIGEMNSVLIELLDEVKPGNYAGTYPPQRSYEDSIFQRELFAFRWLSKHLGCMTYLKFAFEGSHLWLVSLHSDRDDPKGR
jgi:hypothetical protein